MNEPTPRVTLRELPLSARLVLTAFLLAVGLGYGSAMVQLHFQHTNRDGSPMPTRQDVVERFHGKEGPLVSTLERLLRTETGKFDGSGTMVPAFFKRDDGGFKRAIKKRPEAEVRAEREGERQAVLAWIDQGAPRKAYKDDAFPIPASLAGKPVTPDFKTDDGASFKVRSILETRCVRCHGKDGDPQAENFPLDSFEKVSKYARVDRGMISLEKLTQSTHAHLLSFAMLWALTGLIFAFTSYPGWLRLLLAPLVLVAQIADVCCWWLARIPGPTGAAFATAIMATGAVVGVGLALQIQLSLLNMYGRKGLAVLLLLILAGGFGAYVATENVIRPYLLFEQEEAEAAREAAAKEKDAKGDKKDDKPVKEDPAPQNGPDNGAKGNDAP